MLLETYLTGETAESAASASTAIDWRVQESAQTASDSQIHKLPAVCMSWPLCSSFFVVFKTWIHYAAWTSVDKVVSGGLPQMLGMKACATRCSHAAFCEALSWGLF